MIEIKVTVTCPELAELAAAVRSRCAVPATPAVPAPAAPVTAPVTHAPATPAPGAAPVTAPAAPVVATAPTTAPSYTVDQLAKVGADLVQEGKMPQLLALLSQFGAQSVTQLPPEKYGPFALALRNLGGNI